MSVWAVIKFWWSVLSLHSSSFTAVPSVWEGHGGMVLKRMCGDWRGRVNPGSPTDTIERGRVNPGSPTDTIERGRVNPGSPTDTIERGKWSDVSWSRSTSWMKISYWKPSRIWRDYLLTDWFTTTFSGVSLVYWDDTIGVLSVNPPCVCVCVCRCRLSYYAVFDGHGGSRAAKYAAQHLHKIIADKFPKGNVA